MAKLVAALLVPAGEPAAVAIDDTLSRRRGKKIRAAPWFHDGSAPTPAKTGHGKQIFGAGQARNRTARAVERVIPFQLACQAIAVTWYATAGHDPADVQGHRARAPW